MGNGQNRTKRGGARTRHGPHRGAAASGDRRSATHLMPQSPTDSADATAPTDESQAPEPADEPASEPTAELAAEPAAESPAPEPAHEAPRAAAAEPTPADEPSGKLASDANETAPEVAANETPGPQQQQEASAAPEIARRAPRGRFERFYAPGQGARVEQNGHTGAGANGAARHHPTREAPSTYALPAAQAAQSAPIPHVANDPLAAQPVDDDEAEMPPSGPREDVRGVVGGLIDSLHDLFTQDRAIASQGSSSRCGICYLHFPVAELVYRDAEGFYVCQACGRALGSARVSMVRRQQRL